MSTRTPAKPCTLRVTVSSSYGTQTHEVTNRYYQPIRFRSVRAARRGILAAARCMDYLSRSFYEIEIVTDAGQIIPVRESVVDFVVEWNANDSYHNSIGARLGRGEVVWV